VVVTAGHCISEEDQELWRFVLGYRIGAQGAPTTIRKNQIFEAKAILNRSEEVDYAIVRLDRAVPVPSLALESVDTARGQGVFVVGYPSGLPQKIAGNATVRTTEATDYFVANLDTFGGNSGSPVFSNSNKVIGILVRGETDYRLEDDCQRAVVCPTTGCRGEHVVKLSRFRDVLPTVTTVRPTPESPAVER
jgi:V8-like Glu-specific endopeptidase